MYAIGFSGAIEPVNKGTVLYKAITVYHSI